MSTLFHVLGSGDATNPGKHIMRARLEGLPENAHAVLYGRQQPGMTISEAASAAAWLDQYCPDVMIRALNEDVKSTSQSLASVLAYVALSVAEHYPVLADVQAYNRHVVVTNWPYVLRTRYLLWKLWQRDYSHIPWSTVSSMVTVQGVGGTFVPYFREKYLFAIPWWLWKVAARECGAWIKALIDPYDERLNQRRGSGRVF